MLTRARSCVSQTRLQLHRHTLVTMATTAAPLLPRPPAFSSSPSAGSSTTPPDYAHLTFQLPTKRYVGMLKCQLDPLAQTLVTEVVRCDKVQPAPQAAAPSKGAKAKKAAAASAADPQTKNEADPQTKDEFEVELLDTVLFPEGGGQPSDTGALVALVDGQDGDAQPRVTVRQVVRRNLDAVHYVDQPLEVGTKVRVEVDMARRIDQCAPSRSYRPCGSS